MVSRWPSGRGPRRGWRQRDVSRILTSACASSETELPSSSLCVAPARLWSLVPPRSQEKSVPPAAALGSRGRVLRGRWADAPSEHLASVKSQAPSDNLEQGFWPPTLHPLRSKCLTLETGCLDQSRGFLTSGALHRCAHLSIPQLSPTAMSCLKECLVRAKTAPAGNTPGEGSVFCPGSKLAATLWGSSVSIY